MFQINNKFPKKEFAKDYRDWVIILQELEDKTKEKELLSKKYGDIKEMIREDLCKILKSINDVWKELLEKFGK